MSARSLIPSLTLMVLLSLGPATAAHADGKFYPSYEVASHPTIPSQRAMIIHRDGIETMIVESTVEEAGESFSWILPLPSVPTQIEAGTPGTLVTLTQLVQPEITGDEVGQRWFRLGAIVLVLGIALALHIQAGRSGVGRTERIICRGVIPALLGMALLASVLLLPALSKAGRGVGDVSPGVVVLDTQRVGDYDITVIRGESGSAVRDWLTDNGYACDDESRAILDKYASEGWCFAAAKLTADADRAVTPHPLEVAFPCDAPIYPMRLTGVEAIDLQLDLFIVADRRAETDHLECWYSDRLRPTRRLFAGQTGWGVHPDRGLPIVAGDAFGISIGHPRVTARCWHGCIITHLRGTLTPEDMQEDIAIDLVDHIPFRRHIYAPRAAWGIIVGALVMCIGVALPVVAAWERRSGKPQRYLKGRSVAAIVLLVIAAPMVAYQCFDVHRVSLSRSPRSVRWASLSLAYGLYEIPEPSSIENAAELRRLLDAQVLDADAKRNVSLHLDAPACYTATDTQAGVLMTLYDDIAAPMRVLIPRDGTDLLWDATDPADPATGSTGEN